jgi:hypothetical protein
VSDTPDQKLIRHELAAQSRTECVVSGAAERIDKHQTLAHVAAVSLVEEPAGDIANQALAPVCQIAPAIYTADDRGKVFESP